VRNLHRRSVAPTAAACLLLIQACAYDRGLNLADWPPASGVPARNLSSAVVADYQPGVDYFPEKAVFRHAEQITVSYHGHYKVARVTTRGVGEQFEYVFVQRGTPVPDVAPDARVVAVPIRRFSLGTYRYGRAAENPWRCGPPGSAARTRRA
jgi:iron complex transport system substrate-binding protein